MESQTVIGVVRRFVEQWRKQQGWSEQTLADELVKTHALLDGPQRTGICFEPSTRDAQVRSRVNAERIRRWLDDEGKCVNLLPVNFLPTILLAMPQHLRQQCVNAILSPLDLQATTRVPQSQSMQSARSGERFDSDSMNDDALLPGDASSPMSLELALRDLDESIALKQRIREAVERALVHYATDHPFARLL